MSTDSDYPSLTAREAALHGACEDLRQIKIAACGLLIFTLIQVLLGIESLPEQPKAATELPIDDLPGLLASFNKVFSRSACSAHPQRLAQSLPPGRSKSLALAHPSQANSQTLEVPLPDQASVHTESEPQTRESPHATPGSSPASSPSPSHSPAVESDSVAQGGAA